jgi:putative FmdB family regulatory protein
VPIYLFKCKKCGHVQEIVTFKDNEQNHMPCLKCGVCLWEKVPAVSNFVLSENFKRNM